MAQQKQLTIAQMMKNTMIAAMIIKAIAVPLHTLFSLQVSQDLNDSAVEIVLLALSIMSLATKKTVFGLVTAILFYIMLF